MAPLSLSYIDSNRIIEELKADWPDVMCMNNCAVDYDESGRTNGPISEQTNSIENDLIESPDGSLIQGGSKVRVASRHG